MSPKKLKKPVRSRKRQKSVEIKNPDQTTPKTSSESLKTKANGFKTYKIDARDKILGRLATEVANLLRGKNKVGYRPNILNQDKVIVFHAKEFRVTGNKMLSKTYYHHTGYIGHLKKQTMKEVYQKNPSEVIRRAVRGMLCKNKLQDKWMKNLTIINGDIND